jgi:hypothetical protein
MLVDLVGWLWLLWGVCVVRHPLPAKFNAAVKEHQPTKPTINSASAMDAKQSRYRTAPSDLYDASQDFHHSKRDDGGDDYNEDVNELAPLHDSNTSVYESITKSIFANSTSSSSLLRRQRGIQQKSNETPSGPTYNIESILQEYTAACQIYGCADRINAGILTTLRFRLPSLRVSGSFFDADMLALAEVLLHHINGALSYIRRLDFSLAAMEGKQFGKKGIRSHGAYALSKVLQMSLYIEEVFLPGELNTQFWHSST